MGAHLWIPEPETKDPSSDQTASSSRLPQLLRERLYVGNLSPAVDEYTLLKVFSKFGKVSKLDFLYHKAGPNKGKPRGYAFIEFLNEADIEKARQSANGKLLRGRKLVVTFAQQAPHNDLGSMPHGGKTKRVDATPTALSLAKSSGIARPEAKTSSKIAMMEAKLRQMGSSSSFIDKPSLPRKLITPASFSGDGPKGPPFQKASRTTGTGRQLSHLTHIGSKAAVGPPLAPPSNPPTESSDATRIPSSNKHRSIPGVKIVKGRLK
ncbi:hypothetical protein BU15DRAFT_52761 [Melanogaster broomeanus]|nr:hypothetical protein BU15DRAFT_52761 [Melanogaster broomeanus]